MTISDHAAARDSHRRDDRGDQSGKGAQCGYLRFAPSDHPPGAPTSPPPLRHGHRVARAARLAGVGPPRSSSSDRETGTLMAAAKLWSISCGARAHQMRDPRIVTLLFIDVEASTSLLGSLGDA